MYLPIYFIFLKFAEKKERKKEKKEEETTSSKKEKSSKDKVKDKEGERDKETDKEKSKERESSKKEKSGKDKVKEKDGEKEKEDDKEKSKDMLQILKSEKVSSDSKNKSKSKAKIDEYEYEEPSDKRSKLSGEKGKKDKMSKYGSPTDSDKRFNYLSEKEDSTREQSEETDEEHEVEGEMEEQSVTEYDENGQKIRKPRSLLYHISKKVLKARRYLTESKDLIMGKGSADASATKVENIGSSGFARTALRADERVNTLAQVPRTDDAPTDEETLGASSPAKDASTESTGASMNMGAAGLLQTVSNLFTRSNNPSDEVVTTRVVYLRGDSSVTYGGGESEEKMFKTRAVQTDPIEFDEKNATSVPSDAQMNIESDYLEYLRLGGKGSWMKMPKMFRKTVSYADVIERKKKVEKELAKKEAEYEAILLKKQMVDEMLLEKHSTIAFDKLRWEDLRAMKSTNGVSNSSSPEKRLSNAMTGMSLASQDREGLFAPVAQGNGGTGQKLGSLSSVNEALASANSNIIMFNSSKVSNIAMSQREGSSPVARAPAAGAGVSHPQHSLITEHKFAGHIHAANDRLPKSSSSPDSLIKKVISVNNSMIAHPDTSVSGHATAWSVPNGGKGVHPQQSKPQLYTVIYKNGANIRATPSAETNFIGTLNAGDEVYLTGKEIASTEEPGTVYCKVSGGGWIRKVFNGEPVLRLELEEEKYRSPQRSVSPTTRSPTSPPRVADSYIDGEPARHYTVEHQSRQLSLLLNSGSLVIAHPSQLPITTESVCTRVQLADIIGADVNASGDATTSSVLFRLRIWRQDETGERTEGTLVLKAIEPSTPGPFLRALSTIQAHAQL